MVTTEDFDRRAKSLRDFIREQHRALAQCNVPSSIGTYELKNMFRGLDQGDGMRKGGPMPAPILAVVEDLLTPLKFRPGLRELPEVGIDNGQLDTDVELNREVRRGERRLQRFV